MVNSVYLDQYYSAWGTVDETTDTTTVPKLRSMYRTVPLTCNESSLPKLDNFRKWHYLSLQKALFSLSHLDEEDDFHITPEVAERASVVLGIIAENIDIDPPKFFPQDGEAAVFTWEEGNIKRFLTVDDEDIDLMDLEKTSFIQCSYDLPEDGNEQLSFALKELSGAAWLTKSTAD